MEYVDGQPITTYCDERRLPVYERLRLLTTVSEALHYAHRNLVVHRDLKPSNVLVTEEGRAVLLDEAENPFEVDERLEELASELQSEYPDHDLTQEVVDAVEGTSPPSEERVGELIEDAEQLLDGVDEQLRRIRETMDELEDGSVVLVESLD